MIFNWVVASIFGNASIMNKKIIFVLVFGILFGQKLFAQEEQRCNSYEYEQYLKATVPGFAEMMEQSEIYFQNYIKSLTINHSRKIPIIIPVVVHLLYNPDSVNHQLSDWQITSQIDALNEDYRRFNADKFKTPSLFDSIGADCEIEFCLATRDPNGNTTNGIRRISTTTLFQDFSSPKQTATGGDDAWPNSSYLNIWVCPLEYPMLGYATFPVNIDSNDGVVIHYKAFGRINCFSKKYYEGRTATHEIGHWLNLVHIWGDSPGCSPDDNVDDTPVQAEEHYHCEVFPFPSCNNTSDMFENYMDYTNDSCMNIFTFGQRERMLATLNLTAYRSSILTSNGCNSVSAYNNDIGIIKILNPDEFIYGDSLVPVVTIHNFGSQTITSAEIFYAKNWKSHLNTFHWTGSLAPNESVDITLPKIIDSSWYNLFCAWTKNPNGNQDEDTTNDFKTRSYIVSLQFPPITDAVKIYPNPTGSLIILDFGEIVDLNGKVSVYNVLGQMEQVNMEALSVSKFQIDLSNFPSALYFIELNVNGEKVVKKVIVQHEL